MIAIVDYRAGNLTSVLAALNYLGHDGKITSDPAEIGNADHVVFPGVGAAGEAMAHLRELNLEEPLRAAVAAGKPFLGICLGYQILFEHSQEDGGVDCLGLLPGKVVHFAEGVSEEGSDRPLKIPQMGWNRVKFSGDHPVWAGLPEASEFYFVHSYHPVPSPEVVCATATYGYEFACGATRDNMVAFQFHPEKSGRPGLHMLDNFCKWNP